MPRTDRYQATLARIRAEKARKQRKASPPPPRPKQPSRADRIDPSRTTKLRAQFLKQIKARYAQLREAIISFVIEEDALGLERQPTIIIQNAEGLATNAAKKYEAATVQAIPETLAVGSTLREIIDGIDADDILKTPSVPHITILYGLDLDQDVDEIRDLTAGYGSVKARMTGLSLFENEGEDVLIYSVESSMLSDLHNRIKTLPNTDTHPEYRPHLTVAYLKPGTGKKYVRPTILDGAELTFDRLNFSANDKEAYLSLNVFNGMTVNAGKYAFKQDPEKVKEFVEWLRLQFSGILTGATEEELWNRFAEEGFRKGAGRAFEDAEGNAKTWLKDNPTSEFDHFSGGKEKFLRDAFGQPENITKVKMLAGRSFEDMVGVTDDTISKMRRTLTDGLVEGKNPRAVAKDLTDELDISYKRAEVIARTEIMRAHSEGQLSAFKSLGIEEVGAAVEWSTAGDDRVCSRCQPLEGVVLKLDEARNMLPLHPQCRCTWIPAGVGEDQSNSVTDPDEIRSRFIEAGVDGMEIDDDRPQSIVGNMAGSWVFNTAPLSRKASLKAYARRVKAWNSRWMQNRLGVVVNAFCPTGEGGGVDPSCSPGEVSTSVGSKVQYQGKEYTVTGGGMVPKRGPNKGKQPVILRGPNDTPFIVWKDELTGEGKTPPSVMPVEKTKTPPAEVKPPAEKVVPLSKRKMSDKEADGLETYIGSEHDVINHFLRTGKPPDYVSPAAMKNTMARAKESIDGVDSLMAASSDIKPGTTLFRGVGGKYAEELLNSKPGDVHLDKAFMSTTSDESHAKGWGEWATGKGSANAELRLSVGEGIKGFDVSKLAKGSGGRVTDKEEKETLLERGLSIRVDRVEEGRVYGTLIKSPTTNAYEFAANAFCPTGPGGGIDNTCSPSGGGGGGGSGKLPSIGGLKKISNLGGSTGAVLMKDPSTDKLYVVKTNGSQAHLKSEALADDLYRILGAKVPASDYQEGVGKLSEFLDGQSLSSFEKSAPEFGKEAVKDTLQDHFVADVLLGNWDVIGMGKDNILITDDGEAMRIDNGGSLAFRAQGEPKGDKWNGNALADMVSMRDGTINPNTAEYFKDLDMVKIHEQVGQVLDKKAEVLAKMKEYGEDTAIMEQRFAGLQKFNDMSKKVMATATPKAEPPPVPKSTTGTPVPKPDLGVTPTPTPEAPKASAHLKDGKSIVDHLAANPSVTAKFTETDLKKLAFLNPEGIKNGTVYVGKIHQNAAIKAAEEAKSEGKHLQSEQVEHLKKILPPGTKIKAQHVTQKDMDAAQGKTATPKPAPIPLESTPTPAPAAAKPAPTPKAPDPKPATPAATPAPAKPTLPPLPKTYGELQPGHTYINSQGKTKVVESVDKVTPDQVQVKFKGEPGTVVLPNVKTLPSQPSPDSGTSATATPTTYTPQANPNVAKSSKNYQSHADKSNVVAPATPGFQVPPEILSKLKPPSELKKPTTSLMPPTQLKEHADWADKMANLYGSGKPGGEVYGTASSWKGSSQTVREQFLSGKLTPSVQKWYEELQKQPPYQGTVYRGLSGPNASALAKQLIAAGVGGTWTDKAPHNTSLNPKMLDKFGSDLGLRIITKSGMPHWKLDGYSEDGPHGEKEIVGKANTTYRIAAIHKDPGEGFGGVNYLVDLYEE